MTDGELLELLEEGLREAVRLLVEKVRDGQASAADIAQLRALHKDAGGALSFSGRTTELGDDVLASLSDVDPSIMN